MYGERPSSFDKILVGIDLSETGSRALIHALLLAAERDDAVLHVAHVAGPAGDKIQLVLEDGVHVVSLDEAVAHIERYVETARVGAITEGEPIESERVKIHVCVGDYAEELVDLARSLGAKLLVVGTHGRSGVKRLVIGSVAESVMRTAPCAVLVVRPVAYPEPEAG
jgi:nucleotide-binding universal stress UspA family protein